MNFNSGPNTNVTFRKLVVTVVSSNKLWKTGQANSIIFVDQRCCNQKLLKVVKNWIVRPLLKGQWCGNEILESSIASPRKWAQSTLSM